MPILTESAKDIAIPEMFPVMQLFPDVKIKDVYSTAKAEIKKKQLNNLIRPGKSVAVLVGSRGIASLKYVVKAVIEMLINMGVKPFIVPAMGSHGGGVAKEQKKIIESYGITEEYLGIPICSSMETTIIGETADKIPIHIDKFADRADYIVPVVRIKAHTDFSGPIESGLCKMLSIGIGKHNGCSRLHQEGFSNFSKLIPNAASVVLNKKNVPFGVAIIEDAHENVHTICAVPGSDILSKEPSLLSLSKSLMPRLYFDHIDVLIVEQIGKDITGAGMDPNITGRTTSGSVQNFSGPSISRIVVLDLTEKTHNNAVGVGNADFITKKLYDKIDLISTYSNAIASGNPGSANIPVVLDSEREAVLAAIQTCPGIDHNNAKIVKIKDTLHLVNIEISENLLPYCRSRKNFYVPEH